MHLTNSYARPINRARARARTFDSQLLTAVARDTLITSRYWPSRNIIAYVDWCEDAIGTIAVHPRGSSFSRSSREDRAVARCRFHEPSGKPNRADVARERARLSAHAPDGGAELERDSDLESRLFLRSSFHKLHNNT